jgi:hypothetical protein
VEAHIPSWTIYGQGNQYFTSSDDGGSENVFSQEAFHGQWVTLAGGTHTFTAGRDYTVELTLADKENGFCKYQMADQMRWVYDGTPSPKEEEKIKEEEGKGKGVGEPPADLSPPVIAGRAVEGQTLTVSPGKWTGSSTSFAQQWERCTTASQSCTPVAGATASTYRLVSADVEHQLRVREIGSNAAGSSIPVYSEESRLVGIPALAQEPSHPSCPAAHAARSSRPANVVGGSSAGIASTASHRKRHHRRIALGSALRKTVNTSRHFALTLQFTAGVRRFLGDSCAAPLTGEGVVNFKKRQASWTVALPAALGGTIHAVARRGIIYLSGPLVTPKGGWLMLRTRADYAAFDKVPLLRDVVVLTDPLGSVTLVASARTHSRRHHGATHASARPPASQAASVPSVKTSCDNGTKVADSSGETSKQLTDTFSFGTTAEGDALKAWSKNKVSAEANQDGLCEIKATLENADNNGFDVTIEFANPVAPITIPMAGLKDAVTYTQTYHFREACFAGTWEGTEDGLYVPAVETSIGTATSAAQGEGTVTLVMNTTAATVMTTQTFKGGYTHPFPEFIFDGENLLTVEGSITVPYTAVRSITASGPVVLTGKDGIALSLAGQSEVTIDAPPFTITPSGGPYHLQASGTLTCPSSISLSAGAGVQLTLHKTSSVPAFPVLTSAEQTWQQQLQAASKG